MVLGGGNDEGSEPEQLPEPEKPEESLLHEAARCGAKVLGLDDLIDVSLIAAGQPIPQSKRFRTPGSSAGTSWAGMAADRVFGDRRFSRRMPTLVGGPGTGRRLAVAGTTRVARFAGRAVPIVGWGLLALDAVQFGVCLASD